MMNRTISMRRPNIEADLSDSVEIIAQLPKKYTIKI